MKKILIALMLLTVTLLAACSNGTTTTKNNVTSSSTKENTTTLNNINFEAPTGLKIEEGIVTFSEVTGAEKYYLKVTQDGETVINMEVTIGASLLSVLEDGDYVATIRSFASNKYSNPSEPYEFTIGVKIGDITSMKVIEGEDLTVQSYVNFNGRTNYDILNKRMYFYYTASGFKVNFYGTSLNATFFAGNSSAINKEARLIVLVDGEIYPEGGHLVVLNQGQVADYALVSGLTEGSHTVEVLKRSEASNNVTAVTKIETDGHFEAPTADKEKKILVIGASGSTGYGNLENNANATQNTLNSDGMKAFPYLTARMFDTDIDEINASGWGVKWGWYSQTGTSNIPSALTRVGINQSNALEQTYYNHLNDSYDLIIVNLGMNDFNAYLSKLTGTQKEQKINEYKAAVEEFYRILLDSYNVPIVLLHTSNTNQNAEGIYNEEIAAKINAELESPMIHSIIIPANGSGTQYGANSHANVQTHIWTADLIAEWIEANLNWTKVRNNITFDPVRDVLQK